MPLFHRRQRSSQNFLAGRILFMPSDHQLFNESLIQVFIQVYFHTTSNNLFSSQWNTIHKYEYNNYLCHPKQYCYEKTQHSIRSGRTCLSQLLEHHNKILEELEKSNNVDVIYLDFVKAFDKVGHGILLNKLKKIGINGKIGV